jgi:hypothetical protein
VSGFVQQGAVKAVASGTNQPTITGVTSGNALICVYEVNDASGSFSAPTDSAGQTWTIRTQLNSNTVGVAIAYLFNANAGTHTLTWATQSFASEACLSEWNGITGVGATAPTGTTSSGATSLTSGSYTPSQANEVIIALGGEFGSATNDAIHVTTTGFESIGTTTDSASHNCIAVEQNGNTYGVFEGNAQIVTSASALTCAWAWTPSQPCSAVICGFAYTPSGSSGIIEEEGDWFQFIQAA